MTEDLRPREPAPFVPVGERYLAAHAQARRIAAGLAVAAPLGAATRAAGLDAARAQFHRAYADLVTTTRDRMTGIAARTVLARLEARGAHPPGDPAADAGVALADQRGRAEAEDAAQEAERRASELAAGHGAALGGFAPLAGMGMLGRAFGADGAHRAARYAVACTAPDDLELRLRELTTAVAGPARGWTSFAVAEVADDAGRLWRVIGTTELDGYLRPGVALREGELAAGNEAWPELSIATFCAAHGFAPGPVVGSVEPPGDVCDHLRAQGFAPSWSDGAWGFAGEESDAPVE